MEPTTELIPTRIWRHSTDDASGRGRGRQSIGPVARHPRLQHASRPSSPRTAPHRNPSRPHPGDVQGGQALPAGPRREQAVRPAPRASVAVPPPIRARVLVGLACALACSCRRSEETRSTTWRRRVVRPSHSCLRHRRPFCPPASRTRARSCSAAIRTRGSANRSSQPTAASAARRRSPALRSPASRSIARSPLSARLCAISTPRRGASSRTTASCSTTTPIGPSRVSRSASSASARAQWGCRDGVMSPTHCRRAPSARSDGSCVRSWASAMRARRGPPEVESGTSVRANTAAQCRCGTIHADLRRVSNYMK